MKKYVRKKLLFNFNIAASLTTYYVKFSKLKSKKNPDSITIRIFQKFNKVI